MNRDAIAHQVNTKMPIMTRTLSHVSHTHTSHNRQIPGTRVLVDGFRGYHSPSVGPRGDALFFLSHFHGVRLAHGCVELYVRASVPAGRPNVQANDLNPQSPIVHTYQSPPPTNTGNPGPLRGAHGGVDDRGDSLLRGQFH